MIHRRGLILTIVTVDGPVCFVPPAQARERLPSFRGAASITDRNLRAIDECASAGRVWSSTVGALQPPQSAIRDPASTLQNPKGRIRTAESKTQNPVIGMWSARSGSSRPGCRPRRHTHAATAVPGSKTEAPGPAAQGLRVHLIRAKTELNTPARRGSRGLITALVRPRHPTSRPASAGFLPAHPARQTCPTG